MENQFKVIGIATTIGELKKLISQYPDETSFGFFNQGQQQLEEVTIGKKFFVVFKELTPEMEICEHPYKSVISAGTLHHCVRCGKNIN